MSVSRGLSYLLLYGVVLLQTDPVHNLEVLLDLWLLLKEQVIAMTRRAFAQLCVVCQLCPFLNRKILYLITHTLVILLFRLLPCTLHGTTLVSGSFCWCRIWPCGQFWEHGTPLLHKLHWMPVCFWIQFKMLVVTFKALQNRLLPISSVHPTQPVREDWAFQP